MSNTTDQPGQQQHQKLTIIQKLQSTPSLNVVKLPEVADRFQNLYALMNGKDKAAAAIKYESEKFHFMKLLQDKPELQQCTPLSLYGCFLDGGVSGLSFDPAMKHGYLMAQNVNVGTQQQPQWEKRAEFRVSGPGELLIRMQQGQIKYADNPVLVYEGDVFSRGVSGNVPFLEHKATFPRASKNIIACYIRLERVDGSSDFKVLGMDDILRLKEFSTQKNGLAYTEKGLPGMIETKTIKHAFRAYPKMKLGQFTKPETSLIEPDEKFKLDYGLDEGDLLPGSQAPASSTEPAAGEIKNLNENMGNLDNVQPAIQITDDHQSDDTFIQPDQPAPGPAKKYADDDF